jgi:hypothetical protein
VASRCRPCETKPIFRGRRVGRGPRGVGRGANVQNEANLRSPGRTGTPEPCRLPGSSILPFHHSSPVPIVQDKANSNSLSGFRRLDCAKQSQTWAGWDIWEAAPRGGRLCETNPIPAGPGGTGPWGQKAIMQNKPNSGGCRVGTPNPPRVRIAQNEAYPRSRIGERSVGERLSCGLRMRMTTKQLRLDGGFGSIEPS